jgi:hypothetical protein
VPYNKYRVIAQNDTTFPISNKLQAVRDKVLVGNFVDAKITPRISFSNYVGIDLGMTSPVKKAKGCSCKKDVIRDEDVKRRGSSATVDARAMGLSLDH